MVSKRNILFLVGVFALSTCVNFVDLSAADTMAESMQNGIGFGRGAAWQKNIALSQDERLKIIERQLAGLRDRKAKGEADLDEKIEEYQRELDKVLSYSGNIVSTSIARGLAGKEAWNTLDLQAESIGRGLAGGLGYRFMVPIGDKIEAEMKVASDSLVGGGLRWIIEYLLSIKQNLFNGGYRPLNAGDLSEWGQGVDQIILEELEKRALDSVSNANSNKKGRMESLLQMQEVAGEELPTPAEFAQQQEDKVWRLKVEGYARDLSYMVQNLEGHKPYYLLDAKSASTEFNIICHVSRLQDDLCLLRDKILLPCRTLKELAAGDTKIYIVQIRKDLKKRFELLGAILKRHHGGSISESAITPAQSGASRPGYGYGATA